MLSLPMNDSSLFVEATTNVAFAHRHCSCCQPCCDGVLALILVPVLCSYQYFDTLALSERGKVGGGMHG